MGDSTTGTLSVQKNSVERNICENSQIVLVVVEGSPSTITEELPEKNLTCSSDISTKNPVALPAELENVLVSQRRLCVRQQHSRQMKSNERLALLKKVTISFMVKKLSFLNVNLS